MEDDRKDREGVSSDPPIVDISPLPPPPPRIATSGHHLPPLGPWARVLLLILSWILILLGVAMLVLPGPGILAILLGAAVLSLVSHWVHRLLERIFRPWPHAWRRVLAFRRKVHRWFGPPK